MGSKIINWFLGIEEPTKIVANGNSTELNTAVEKTLNTIATIVLWVGIICTVFCLATLTTTKVINPSYHYSIHYDTIFNPSGLVISVGVLISSLISSALLKVIANISITLKEINSKMK